MKLICKITLEININGLSNTEVYDESELLIYDNKLLLKVKAKNSRLFSMKLKRWDDSLEYPNFGNTISCKNANLNDKRIEMDFSESKLISYTCSTDSEYVEFLIKEIIYTLPVEKSVNSATFTLNNAGHYFVQCYYGGYYHDFDTLEASLPNRKDIAHEVLDACCTPVFFFGFSDGLENTQIVINKVPQLKWTGYKSVTEVLEYNQWICMLASLFFSTQIEYRVAAIDFDGKRTILRRVTNDISAFRNLFPYLKGMQYVYNLLNRVSFEKIQKHKTVIDTMVSRYMQTLYLDGATKYIVLYNIIEVFQKESYKECLNKKNKFNNIAKIKKKYDAALDAIINSGVVIDYEQKDFVKRWSDVWTWIQEKPIGNEINIFLMTKKIDIEQINKCIQKEMKGGKETMVSLRNRITHGGTIQNIPNVINDMLSFIAIFLILDILGCVDVEISKFRSFPDILIKE